MPKNEDLMITLLNEMRSEQKTHSKILIKMTQDVSRNADDLQTHMSQTKAIKELVVDHRKDANVRLGKLEEPRIAFKLLKKYLIGIGSVAAAILGVLKFLDYL